MHVIVVFLSFLVSLNCLAQEVQEGAVQVGKHVTANTGSLSMVLSLLMVLVLIIICAWVLKKFQLVKQSDVGLKVVSSLHLGAKERVIVVQAGKKQLLLGVTSQQISVLDTLEEPLKTNLTASTGSPQPIPKFLQKLFSNNQTLKNDNN